VLALLEAVPELRDEPDLGGNQPRRRHLVAEVKLGTATLKKPTGRMRFSIPTPFLNFSFLL